MRKILSIVLILTLLMSSMAFADPKEKLNKKDNEINIEDVTVDFYEMKIDNIVENEEQSTSNNLLYDDSKIQNDISIELVDEVILKDELSLNEDLTFDNKYEDQSSALLSSTPDILVYALDSVTAQPLQGGEDVVFTFITRNIGFADTGNYNVTMKINESTLATLILGNMEPDQAFRYNITLSSNVVVKNGINTVTFIADESNIITELDETNNTVSKAFSWINGLPNLKGINLTTFGAYITNTDINFTYAISNAGAEDVFDFTLGIYVNGNLVGSTQYSQLLALQSGNVSFKINIPTAGDYNIEAKLDHANKEVESNETDNSQLKSISVKQDYHTTWFSKLQPNFNVDRLNILFLPNAGSGELTRTPFEWNDFEYGAPESPYGTTYSRGLLNKYGCVASALASLLDTVGANTTSSQYDFRTNTTGILSPDPATLYMANMGFPASADFTYNNDFNTYEMNGITYNPMYMVNSTSAAYFGYDVYRTTLDDNTDEEKQVVLNQLLDEHPEGVMVRFTENGITGEGGHTLVFINHSGSQSTSSVSDYETTNAKSIAVESILLTREIELAFMEAAKNISIRVNSLSTSTPVPDDYIVSENATTIRSNGDYVPFSTSWCSSQYPDFSNIAYIDVLEKK